MSTSAGGTGRTSQRTPRHAPAAGQIHWMNASAATMARFAAAPSPHSAPLRCSFALGAPGVRLPPRRLPLSHWIKTSAAAGAVHARATGQSFVRFCVQRLLAQCVLLENSALLATGDAPLADFSPPMPWCCAGSAQVRLRGCRGVPGTSQEPQRHPLTSLMCELSVWQTAPSSPRRTAEAASHVGQLSRLCLWSRTQST